MEIKYFDKPGYIAWSNSKNHSELLASASIYEEEGFYTLNLLELDLQQRAKKINVIGSGYTTTPFRSIAWDNFGERQNLYSHGLIFTGMDDGSFRLWNPHQMIATYNPQEALSAEGMQSQTCLIYEQQPDDGAYPIMCGEWNSLKNNFLAFGGTDVLILDVGKDPSDPQLVKPGKKNPHQKSYVTSVSWNRQVPHILASASENGLVALWDIKVNNCIFNFKDSGVSSGDRKVVICWSKAISTQIAVTLDDDKRNQLQIWDLRNQKGPISIIDKVHNKGINAMDWCQTDPELILSASRDNRLACWNYRQQDAPLSQITSESSIFEVKWSKKLPSIYAVSGEEKISVHSLSDNLFGYVPKWYKVSVGATLLGSQASLSYSEQRGHVLYEAKINQHFKTAPIKAGLKSIGNILQGVFDQNENDSELNALLKAKTSNEADNGIYEYLGLNKEKIVTEVQKYTGKKRQFQGGYHKATKQKSIKPKAKAYTQLQGLDALAFFQQIGNKKTEPIKQQDQENNEGEIKYDMIPRNFNWDMGKERLVKQNILIGNYQGAIDAALKCGRTAQALIIAFSVDQNLFSNTLKTYFTQTTDNFITDILKNIAYRDPIELINKYDLSKWKQCIALIFSMASRDKRPQLLSQLAKRLIEQTQEANCETQQQIIHQGYAPIICYILAQDFGKIASIYSNNLKLFKSGSIKRKQAALQYTRRLIAIQESLTVSIQNCNEYQQLLRQSTFIAIEEGEKVIAHSICVRNPNNTRLLDYLVSTTKELQKYKTSVSYKFITLPAMQPRKVEKKVAKTEQPTNKGKKPIFPPKEQESTKSLPPPPPVVKKRPDEEVGGFSPYQNSTKQQQPQKGTAPVKKNLNNPPPPPVTAKKQLAQPIEEPEQERQVFTSKGPIQPPKKTTPPPPPPPPIHHNSHQNSQEQPKTVIKPPQKQPPPPPPQVDKRSPPLPNIPPQKSNTNIPPPVQYKSQPESQAIQRVEPQIPVKKKNPPPPPPAVNKHVPETDHIPTREEHNPPPPPVGPKKNIPPPPPPPAHQKVQEVKPKFVNNAPQQKVQEKRQLQTVQQPMRKQPPLPPPVQSGKRAPPPPPARRG